MLKSREQLADCLTKGLVTKDNESACNKMSMLNIFSPS
jgi:hypothetical protein